MTSVRCVGDFCALRPRQVSTPREPLARLALIGTLVGSPSSGWGWPGHRSGSSPLPGGPLPWAAVKLLASLVPCSVARGSAATQAVWRLPSPCSTMSVSWTNVMFEASRFCRMVGICYSIFLLKGSNLGQDTYFLTQQKRQLC